MISRIASLPPGRSTRRSSRSAALEIGDVADTEPDGRRVERRVAEREVRAGRRAPSRRRATCVCARSSMRSEKSRPTTPPRRAARPRSRDRPCRSRRRGRGRPGCTAACDGEPAPAPVEPGRHHAVHRVVDGRDAVEHRLDARRVERAGLVRHEPHRRTSVLSMPSWSRQRATTKSTRSPTDSGGVVEAGRGEEDHGARLVQRREPAQVDRGQRRLARHEDELAPFLERDGGGAMDEVRHRAGCQRADRGHRAGADDVGVHLRRAARVRALPVVDAVDGDLAVAGPGEPRQHLVAPERRVAVELGREHLDAGRGRADPDLGSRGASASQDPGRVRRPDAPVTPRKTLTPGSVVPRARAGRRLSATSGPSRRRGTPRCSSIWSSADRRTAPSSCSRTSSPRSGVVVEEGDVRPLPIAERSGAP